MKRLHSALVLAMFLVRPASAQDADGYRPMFNGKDLAGWVNVNCDPSTFFVKDYMIVTTGRPTGYMRTDKQYENFTMEFDWMHQNKKEMGNSGLFVWGDPLPSKGIGYTRGIEVQVLVNANVKDSYTSHGDIFSIHGATCKPDRPHPKGALRCLPSEERCKGGGEWNHYKVTGNDGVIKLEVNGKEVSGVSQCNPRKGYLALESEGAECWFKNLKIKELPSTNPRPEEVADVDKGFKTMYYGINLNGWKGDDNQESRWKAQDTRLTFNATSDAKKNTILWTDKSYGDFEMMVDWKGKGNAGICVHGVDALPVSLVRGKNVNDWNRVFLTIKGDRLTLVSGGKTLIDDMPLIGTPAKGPIGLWHGGAPVEFANLFIREVK